MTWGVAVVLSSVVDIRTGGEVFTDAEAMNDTLSNVALTSGSEIFCEAEIELTTNIELEAVMSCDVTAVSDAVRNCENEIKSDVDVAFISDIEMIWDTEISREVVLISSDVKAGEGDMICEVELVSDVENVSDGAIDWSIVLVSRIDTDGDGETNSDVAFISDNEDICIGVPISDVDKVASETTSEVGNTCDANSDDASDNVCEGRIISEVSLV